MIPGQRFEVNLDSDDEDDGRAKENAPLPSAFVADILERNTDASATRKPPTLPVLKSLTGFPGHSKARKVAPSRFKQQQRPVPQHEVTPNPPIASTIASPAPQSWQESERAQIDAENQRKLAEMSPEQIEEERRELLSSLSPALIERLLRRANVASGSNESDLSAPLPSVDDVPSNPSPALLGVAEEKATKSVSFAEADPASASLAVSKQHSSSSGEQDILRPSSADVPTYANTTDSAPLQESGSSRPANPEFEETTAHPTSDLEHAIDHGSIHFPHPPQPPTLDPASPSFLEDLHSKYFPSLPSEPSKLAWMQQPATPSYSPSSTTLTPHEIRFSFYGQLLPPKTALLVPVTEGLHHHASAPESAGYTISELSLLARSTYAAQRCIAFNTLGRILYRLGLGLFGDDELSEGLWAEVTKERVLDVLVAESEGKGVDGGRHVSAKAYATEAVWLWQKGGGRRWTAE